MRSLSIARMLCLLAPALLAPGVARAQGAERAATSVPQGAAAYLAVDLVKVKEFWTQVSGSTVVKALSSLLKKGDKPGGARIPTDLLMALPTQVLDGPVAVALMDEKVPPGQAPSLVVALPIKNLEQMKGILTLIEGQLKEKKTELTTREYQGVTITTVAVADPKAGQPSYALLPDRLVIATRPGPLEKALDATAGRAPNLTADPRFERVRALLAAKPAGAAWFWVDPARIRQRALEAGQGAAEAAKTKLPVDLNALKPMMDAYDAAGGRLELSTEGIGIEGFSLINAENEVGRKILALKGAPLRSAGLVPGSAVFYAGINNIPFLAEMTRGVLGAAGGDIQQMLGGVTQTLQTATGLDLQKDVFAYLGTEAALVLNDLPAKLDKVDVSSIPALFYLQTTNTPGLGKTMQKLRVRLAEAMGMKFIQKDLPQGRLYHLGADGLPIPLTPGWTFAGGFLVVGTTPDAMKSPLFLAKGTGTPLAATPAFQRAVAVAGDQPLAAMFVNLSRLSPGDLMLPKKAGMDPAQVQQLLKALHGVSAVVSVQEGALTVRMDVAADLKN